MDDEPSVRSSAVRGNFTSGRRLLGSSSSVLKVPNEKRGQFRTTGGRSILMRYVNKDRHFTNSHLTSMLFMWNGGNSAQFHTTGGRSILMKGTPFHQISSRTYVLYVE